MTTHMLKRISIVVAVLLATILTAPVAADGLIVIWDPPDHPQPQHRHHRFAPLEVREHHVNVTIDDQIAVTQVNQTFYNPYQQQLEGMYLFPVPKGVQIDKFSMDINGEMIEAELLDADKARKIYTDIVRKMRDPALMEYVGQELFKVRIFPIEGRSEKRINLRYTELLKRDSAMTGYRYGLSTEKYSAAPIKSLSMKVQLNSAAPLATLYCPSHEVDINQPDANHATISFEQSNVRPKHDFEFFYGIDDSKTSGLGFSVLTHRPETGEPGYFMLLAAPSLHLQEQQVLAKDIIFVLDTSGSMAGKKLKQAQNALRFCLANLNDTDRFDIVRFSTEAESLFGELTSVSDARIDAATEFVDSFKARGGTDIASALAAAIDAQTARTDSERPFMVIFLTDGRPTVGTTDAQAIVDVTTKKLGERTSRIFCFGIGHDINTHLLDKVAEKTHATTAYVLPDEDIEVKVSNFYTKVDSPVLALPKMTVQGAVTFTAMQPRELPDVFKGEQVVVFGRYSGSGDAAISIDGNLAGAQRTLVYESAFAPHEPNSEFIAQLWATRRVGWLLDQIRLHGDSAELRDEATLLAKQFGIVTPYTSYLILEDDSMPMAFRDAPGRAAPKARREAGKRYGEMKSEESGQGAVETASRQRNMQDARGLVGAAPDSAADQSVWLGVQKPQSIARKEPVQFVRGRSFYYNGSQWIDSTITDDEQTKRVNIKPFSDEYFELIDQHPDVAAWLALGDNMQMQLGSTVYNITEVTP